jgi:hypothetical protein
MSNPEKTVFVLGAGASYPYGFPLGRGLIISICDELSNPGEYFYNRIFNWGKWGADFIKSFADQLNKSQQPSIDFFLESRPEYLEIGKMCIALSLAENEALHLFERTYDEMKWYEYLYQRIGTNALDLTNSNISFITFNYDRSLEYFFYTAIQNSFTLEEPQIKGIIEKLNIIHFYGSLAAPLFLDPVNGRAFEDTVNNQALDKARKSIQIMSEENMRTQNWALAKREIQTASKILFLGFGYHFVNLDRLIQGVTMKDREVYGTAKGLSPNELKEKTQYFHDNFQLSNEINLIDCTSLELLKATGIF